MSPSDLEARQRRHVLYTWTAQAKASPVDIAGGEGAWFVDHAGQRWLDFESQVFNCNAGHGRASIVEAVQRQAGELACAHPAAVFEAKAALGEALDRITPAAIDRFFLCLSGAEANENAFKIARMFTGRSKVIARRRSYHGASMGALSLTGDPRRMPAEPGLWGVLRAEDPYCYRCPFGLDPASCGTRCATHLEHIIEMEGPDTIAAIFLEGVTGANGGFVPPDDYWPTVRAICDRHGILLVSDEVFSGFGRTGHWFAVDRWGVTPDLITMAKGLTSGYAPLGAVGLRADIADFFADRTLQCGLTSYAHPISCAAALATIELYEREGLIERARDLEPILRAGLEVLQARHPVIGDVRCAGLFGTLELVRDRATREPLVPYRAAATPADALALKRALAERRVHISLSRQNLFVAPPLCISADDLQLGLDHVDRALTEVFGGAAP